MNPKDFYRKLSFSIKDAEIRMVAAVMAEHIGEENLVLLDALCGRVGMGERKVRIRSGKECEDRADDGISPLHGKSRTGNTGPLARVPPSPAACRRASYTGKGKL